MSNRSRGFTSVEFVVAIVLIAVLGLFALSCFHHDRSAALRASCQNNLRQWGLVFDMYSSEDPGGHWPAMSDYAWMGKASITTPDLRAVYPEYIVDPIIGKCPEDSGYGLPAVLPFEQGVDEIQRLMDAGRATEDCLLLHVTLAHSYVYFNYGVTTPAEGEVAWTAWSNAGTAALRGAHGAAAEMGHTPEAFGEEVDLGPHCPYDLPVPTYRLHGRVLGGATAPDGPFMNMDGDILTAWRGDPAADPPTELGWDPEKEQRVPEAIQRLRRRISRNVIDAPGELPQHAFPEAEIPVMWDSFAYAVVIPEAADPTRRLVSNHIPGGANVLFMDGHVEWIRWVPPGGDRFPITATASGVFGDGKRWLNKTVTAMP